MLSVEDGLHCGKAGWPQEDAGPVVRFDDGAARVRILAGGG